MTIVAVDGPTLPDRLGRPAASGPLGNGVALLAVRPQAPIYAPPACVRLLMERRNSHERVLDREVPGR